MVDSNHRALARSDYKTDAIVHYANAANKMASPPRIELGSQD